jgi:hypothetical protein
VSEFRNLIVTATAAVRDFIKDGHRLASARWPHGKVAGSPSPIGRELDDIGVWMKIPRPVVGNAPASDSQYRGRLQKPFTYHRAAGRHDGLLAAVEALGYTNVQYLSAFEVQDPPLWVPVGGGPAVINQNCFGLRSDNFPVGWVFGSPIPTNPVIGRQVRALIEVVNRFKRASARLHEIRVGESKVVTQSWWNSSQDMASIGYVGEETGPDREYVTVQASS